MWTLDLVDLTLLKIIKYKNIFGNPLPPSHTIMQDWLLVSDDVYENGILALTSLV